jgi:cell division protein FtsZ
MVAPVVVESNHLSAADFKDIPATITVIGVGGGGCNVIIRMAEAKPIPGIRYVCVNTDVKSLGKAPVGSKLIYIGERLTRGMGAGGNVEVGAQAAETGIDAVKEAVKDSDLVFITAGMGGGTGTGAAPIVAQAAKSMGAMVIGIATTPFSWEGTRRVETAFSGISALKSQVDNLIVVHNDRILNLCEPNTPIKEALKVADQVVMQGILSVAELVNVPGDINVDLADVKTIMNLKGRALMAVGESRGPGAALHAAQTAVANPLVNLSIDGAKGILFNLKGSSKLTLGDMNAVGEFIAGKVDGLATIFFGMVGDEELEDRVKITVIATGIPVNAEKKE